MTEPRPIGSKVSFYYGPELTSTDAHSGHGHTWIYVVTEHRLAQDETGREFMGECLTPLERLCEEAQRGA